MLYKELSTALCIWWHLFEIEVQYTGDAGVYSIKKVLPALVPELSYEELPIKEGETASLTFSQMIQGTFEGDLEETRKHLLAYCKMDTLAMVEILQNIKGI